MSDSQISEGNFEIPSYAVVATRDYNAATRAAVMQSQQKHAKDILAPFGFARGSGDAGNSTRAKINSLLK